MEKGELPRVLRDSRRKGDEYASEEVRNNPVFHRESVH